MPAWPLAQDLLLLEAVALLTPEQDCPGPCRVTPQWLGTVLHQEEQTDRGQSSEIPSPALGCLPSIKHWSPCFTGFVSDFDIQKPGLR